MLSNLQKKEIKKQALDTKYILKTKNQINQPVKTQKTFIVDPIIVPVKEMRFFSNAESTQSEMQPLVFSADEADFNTTNYYVYSTGNFCTEIGISFNVCQGGMGLACTDTEVPTGFVKNCDNPTFDEEAGDCLCPDGSTYGMSAVFLVDNDQVDCNEILGGYPSSLDQISDVELITSYSAYTYDLSKFQALQSISGNITLDQFNKLQENNTSVNMQFVIHNDVISTEPSGNLTLCQQYSEKVLK